MFRRIGYTIRQSFKQMGRHKSMAFASVFAITAMLLILGMFFIITINLNTATASIRQDYNNIEIFLLDSVDEKEAREMMTQIEDWENVDTVQYRDKGEAMDILKERWGDNAYLLDSLNENPLPNSILVTAVDLEKAQGLAQQSEELDGVENVRYYKDTVDKLITVTNYIQIGALILMIFLICVSVVVVSNTIKLTVLNRAEEISIMKYVGATNWFIRGPFLVEGIILGGMSALLAWGLTAFVYSRIDASFGEQIFAMLSMPLVDQGFLAFNLVWIFLALGISIGAWGSLISMRRFLDT